MKTDIEHTFKSDRDISLKHFLKIIIDNFHLIVALFLFHPGAIRRLPEGVLVILFVQSGVTSGRNAVPRGD